MLNKRSNYDKEGIESTKAATVSAHGNNWWAVKAQYTKVDSKEKWTTMEHNGVSFPDNYKKHNASLLYNGKKILVSTFQEELATYWTQTLGTDWLKNPYYTKNFSSLFLKTFIDKPIKFKTEKDSYKLSEIERKSNNLIKRSKF